MGSAKGKPIKQIQWVWFRRWEGAAAGPSTWIRKIRSHPQYPLKTNPREAACHVFLIRTM
eukprot:8457464-Pyramimonas_sp.AAC.1